jgi:hypothetical protein
MLPSTPCQSTKIRRIAPDTCSGIDTNSATHEFALRSLIASRYQSMLPFDITFGIIASAFSCPFGDISHALISVLTSPRFIVHVASSS